MSLINNCLVGVGSELPADLSAVWSPLYLKWPPCTPHNYMFLSLGLMVIPLMLSAAV